MTMPTIAGFNIGFGTPRRLPKPAQLLGRVVVLDIAFASESGGRKNSFERSTKRFIDALGDRLAAWVDHHDSKHHAEYADDARFLLRKKSQHGACPEMITPPLVERAGKVDTIVCHVDFDGVASAAKWILGGEEPYPGCDADAHAVDTRTGLPSEIGARFDRALRARPRDTELRLAVVAHLAGRLKDEEAWVLIDEAGAEFEPREARAKELAAGYRVLSDELVVVEVEGKDYDRTLLLLLGQQRAKMALVVDAETATFAAPYDSGVNFLERFGLSGGMPTLVSIHRAKLADALVALGVDDSEL
jgi:hypothetical protein